MKELRLSMAYAVFRSGRKKKATDGIISPSVKRNEFTMRCAWHIDHFKRAKFLSQKIKSSLGYRESSLFCKVFDLGFVSGTLGFDNKIRSVLKRYSRCRLANC